MASFFLIASIVNDVIRFKAYAHQAAAQRVFNTTRLRRPVVLFAEPGHKVIDSDGGERAERRLRDAAPAAVATAVHVVVVHVGYAQATLYAADGEADASRAYAALNRRYAKAMWTAGADTAVASYGGSKWVGLCSALATSVLTVAAAAADADAASTSDSSPAEDVEAAYWMVGTMTDDGPRLLAYNSGPAAQRAFNAAAREASVVLVMQPDNNVIDTAGDDVAVQVATDAVAAAAAGALHVVAHHGDDTVATVYASDVGEAAARSDYAAIPSKYAKAMWSTGKDTPVDTDGDAEAADLCSSLARTVLVVAGAVEAAAPAESNGEPAPPPEVVVTPYWLVAATYEQDGKGFLKAYDSAAFAERVFYGTAHNSKMSAAVLLSQPGLVMQSSEGDPDAVEECRLTVEEMVGVVHRVVSWYARDHTEATLFTQDQELDARRAYASIFTQYPRSMWTADNDYAVAKYGVRDGVAASGALATAILTVADTPAPVVPVAYYTVAYIQTGQSCIKAYHTEVHARQAYMRIDEDTPRALAAHPGNRRIESSKGAASWAVLAHMVMRKASIAATTVEWVAVSRVWEHVEASMSPADTASEEAAVAAYDRVKGHKARGVWGVGKAEPVKSHGWEKWVGRCEELAQAILQRGNL